jgi:hypothetical protein
MFRCEPHFATVYLSQVSPSWQMFDWQLKLGKILWDSTCQSKKVLQDSSRHMAKCGFGMFGSWLKHAMPQVSHAIVFLAAVWFTATTTTCHTFLTPCPTCHRLIFLPNFATSVASILFAKLSLAVTVYRRLGMASFRHQPNRPFPSQPFMTCHT